MLLPVVLYICCVCEVSGIPEGVGHNVPHFRAYSVQHNIGWALALECIVCD